MTRRIFKALAATALMLLVLIAMIYTSRVLYSSVNGVGSEQA